jgi:hypothetical protein
MADNNEFPILPRGIEDTILTTKVVGKYEKRLNLKKIEVKSSSKSHYKDS